MTRIVFTAPGSGERHFPEEVLDLKGSIAAVLTLSVAAGAHRYFDVVHAEADNHIAIEFVLSPFRLTNQGYGQGTYEFTVFASAENAPSVQRKIKWAWDGTMNSLRIIRSDHRDARFRWLRVAV